MGQNITMQQLKEQRITPAEKFVLDSVKGAKPDELDWLGGIRWRDEDGKWILVQNFTSGNLWVNNSSVYAVLRMEYGLNYDEIIQLLTRLLHKYTNNGELKILI
jgi:hypothetical protein